MAEPYSEKDAVLENILREWRGKVPKDVDAFFTQFPEYLQSELKRQGYYVTLLPLWGPK